MSHSTWLIIYCVLILAASLLGGWIPMKFRLTHRRMEFAVSFVAGVMLGVGVLHMLPHAFLARVEAITPASTHDHNHDHDHAHDHDDHDDHAGALNLDHAAVHDLLGPILLWLLAGFLVMFFIERFFCFHHHDAPSAPATPNSHSNHHNHHHDHSHAHPGHAPSKHHLTWTGAAVGLSIHSLIEGIALAASVEVGRQHAHSAIPLGLATFLVVFLHKPFDSLTLGTLMGIGGRSNQLRHIVNAAFAALIPAGVVLFYFGLAGDANANLVISAALAFSAGTFLCIAMSDLLPELQFHQHDRLKLSLALLTGLGLAWIISILESNMAH